MSGIETRVQDESDYNRAMLRHMYGGKLWIAPQDVRTLRHIFLEPHSEEYVPFGITPDDLPPMHNLTAGVQEHLSTHLRSRLAQLGATSKNIVLDLSPSTLEKFTHDHLPVAGYILLENLSPRPIVIPREAGIFRFHLGASTINRLEGTALIQAIQEQDISFDQFSLGDKQEITGPYKWVYAPNKPPSVDSIIGVQIHLDPNWTRVITPGTDPIIIPYDNHFYDVREKIHSFFEPVRPDMGRTIWFGRTQGALRLSQRVSGILSPQPVFRDGRTPNDLDKQSPSDLIEYGRTNGYVIFEIESEADPNHRPDAVVIYFYPTHHPLQKQNM